MVMRTGWRLAMVFGTTSPAKSTRTVATPVATPSAVAGEKP